MHEQLLMPHVCSICVWIVIKMQTHFKWLVFLGPVWTVSEQINNKLNKEEEENKRERVSELANFPKKWIFPFIKAEIRDLPYFLSTRDCLKVDRDAFGNAGFGRLVSYGSIHTYLMNRTNRAISPKFV